MSDIRLYAVLSKIGGVTEGEARRAVKDIETLFRSVINDEINKLRPEMEAKITKEVNKILMWLFAIAAGVATSIILALLSLLEKIG